MYHVTLEQVREHFTRFNAEQRKNDEPFPASVLVRSEKIRANGAEDFLSAFYAVVHVVGAALTGDKMAAR